MPPRRTRCDICNQLKDTAPRRENPYEADVNNRTVLQKICDDCLVTLQDEI